MNPNPEAIELLKAYPKKIKWEYLSENSNTNIIELLKEKIKLENNLSSDELDDLPNYKKIDWSVLSANPIVIELLRADPEKIDWIDWKELSANPNAIELLKANQGKINWQALSANPNAFELLKKYPKKNRLGIYINESSYIRS